MSGSPPTNPHINSEPESFEKLHAELAEPRVEIREAADAQLQAELKAKHKELFQQSKEHAKSLGLILSPPKRVHQDTTHSSNATDGVRTWVEIHNISSYSTLVNAGYWNIVEGWFEGPPGKAGNIAPGDITYMHTGGSLFSGMDMEAFYRWHREGASVKFYWASYVADDLEFVYEADENTWPYGDAYHTWDGYTLRCYAEFNWFMVKTRVAMIALAYLAGNFPSYLATCCGFSSRVSCHL
ncbi:hypothetical protein BDV12DRAFT_198949 [Aspergillus spectabilis]